jgi:hypothetical protein
MMFIMKFKRGLVVSRGVPRRNFKSIRIEERANPHVSMPILFRFYMPHPTQIGKTIASRNNLFNNAWTSVLLHCTKIKPQNRPIRSSNLEKWMMIEPTYRNANQNGLPTLIFTVATPFMVEFNGRHPHHPPNMVVP